VLDEPLAFMAVMLDTASKGAGSLLARVPAPTIARFVAAVRATGRAAGLSGSLGLDDVRRLHALRPDFAGFRGAVCAGPRDGPLDARAVRRLRARFAAHAGAGAGAATTA
jgi:dihydroneopterin aldolase